MKNPVFDIKEAVPLHSLKASRDAFTCQNIAKYQKHYLIGPS